MDLPLAVFLFRFMSPSIFYLSCEQIFAYQSSQFILTTSLFCRSACALQAVGLRLSQEWGGVLGAGGPERGPRERRLIGSRCFPLQVVLLGMDILSALVTRLQDRFKAQIGTGELWVGVERAPTFSTVQSPAFAQSPQILHLAVPNPPTQQSPSPSAAPTLLI